MGILIICKFVTIQCLFKSFPLPYLKTLIPCRIRSWLEVVLPTRSVHRPSCATWSHRASPGKIWRITSVVLWLFTENPGCSERFKGFPLFLFYSMVPKVSMVQSGVGWSGVWWVTNGILLKIQQKLWTFIPPVPGCKWEWPTANLGPSEVSAHFCLYFLSFFSGKPLQFFAFWGGKLCCTNAMINFYKICF